ncbi:PGF-CTERM sorting domain-containing protein [Halococcus agarilyticus]|uniref:PGF-CTERM sorting domain-containing protein n=1 Tax=Halococcus agarilyticus TaxID=1232219 RepID=UPI000A7E3BEB|nr:PGF-CTERM sorting domain-containing protein [Halococcus agarilyticus]
MTKAGHSAFMTAIVVVAAVAAVAVGGPAAVALEPDTAAPYPHSPGTTVQEFPVSVVAERNDAVVQNGMSSITLDFGADNRFDGSVSNVSTDDVEITVIGASNQRTVGAFEVAESGDGTIAINFSQRVRVAAGDRILVEVAGMTTPSTDGDYTVSMSTTSPDGTTDGPVSVGYRVASASLTFPNQTASQFNDTQSISLSGVVPNAGYIGVFTVAENGSRGELVGSTGPIIAQYSPRNYTVALDGNVAESQRLEAVVFYETSGGNQGARLNGSFDPNEDAVVANNGMPANATGYVTTLDADGRLMAGSEYGLGARLFFDQGEPNTGYQVQAVENGTLGDVVTQFETPANGSAVIPTAGFGPGQYAITRVDDGSVVSLDGDSTTGAQDDSFFVTESAVETTEASTVNETANGSAGANATTADGTTDQATTEAGATQGTTEDGAGETTAAGDGGDTATAGNESGGGSGDGSSGAFGPGFGPVVAVIALLAAALIAARRTR